MKYLSCVVVEEVINWQVPVTKQRSILSKSFKTIVFDAPSKFLNCDFDIVNRGVLFELNDDDTFKFITFYLHDVIFHSF